MRALFSIIVIFAIATVVAALAAANPGYMLIVFPTWRLQITLNLAIALLLLSFVALYFGARFFSKTVALPGQIKRYRAHKKEQKAYQSLHQSLEALYEGRFTDSIKQARIAYKKGEKSPVAALIAARAAHGLQDDKHYQQWISRAENQDSKVAGLLTEAELALQGGNLIAAEHSLSQLSDAERHGSAAQRLLLEVARAKGDWENMVTHITALRQNRAIEASHAFQLQKDAQLGKLQDLISEPEQQLAYWRSLPKESLLDRAFMETAVPLLSAAGQGAVARRSVEKILKSQWAPSLVRLYVDCAGNNEEADDALLRAEKWLKQHPDDADLLYSLGRQYIHANKLDEAKVCLEKSLALNPRPDVLLALGDLMEKSEQPDEAIKFYQQAARANIPGTSLALTALVAAPQAAKPLPEKVVEAEVISD